MSQSSRIMLTGGSHNRVLCSHSLMCHHCGYIGGGEPINSCTGCGLQTHGDCVPPFQEGVCDACRHPGGTCEICGVHDGIEDDRDSTNRLVPLIVFHGRRWSLGDDGERECLPNDSEVASRLALDPTTTFHPSQLPNGMGYRPMRVEVNGVMYLSHPMFVHSWCTQSVFQFNPAPTMSPLWNPIVDAIDGPRRSEYAEANTQYKMGVINTSSGCAFCGSSRGFQIFCYGHTNSCRGCNNCNWHIRPHLSYTSFHPSCAVRAGMYRVVHPVDGGSGMMCYKSMSSFLPKVHKLKRTRDTSARVRRIERWLEQCSGFNMDIASNIDPSTIGMDVSQTLPVIGGRYSTFPVARARRVIHKRKHAHGTRNRLTNTLTNVVEHPNNYTSHTDASPDTERQHANDNHTGHDSEQEKHSYHTQESSNYATTHQSTSEHRRMTMDESSELIRNVANPQILEAIDVRIEHAVMGALRNIEDIVRREMVSERGIRACEELCNGESP